MLQSLANIRALTCRNQVAACLAVRFSRAAWAAGRTNGVAPDSIIATKSSAWAMNARACFGGQVAMCDSTNMRMSLSSALDGGRSSAFMPISSMGIVGSPVASLDRTASHAHAQQLLEKHGQRRRQHTATPNRVGVPTGRPPRKGPHSVMPAASNPFPMTTVDSLPGRPSSGVRVQPLRVRNRAGCGLSSRFLPANPKRPRQVLQASLPQGRSDAGVALSGRSEQATLCGFKLSKVPTRLPLNLHLRRASCAPSLSWQQS